MSGGWQKSNFGEDGRRGTKRTASSSGGVGGSATNNPDDDGWDSKAAKIMRMMGYRDGDGIGKESQGIRDPIQIEQRRQRLGLGFEATIIGEDETLPEKLKWNIQETVEIHETVDWIPDLDEEIPTFETFQSWLSIGEKKLRIDDETNFVDPDVLKWILKNKNALDHMGDADLFHARSRSNPYETIKKGIFMNRAAMKMANIDSILGFECTNPKTPDREMVVKEPELLYFADICAGPGGFSEYILWRKKWLAKGFGFTLKGPCDFEMDKFVSGPPESFEPHYGVAGDGDIYNPENCKSFIDYVLKHTEGLGVHFVMADGGFSVKGQENLQEILSKQLYLSQALVALGIIREGGSFICKLFDVFTPFSAGLVYILRFCFEKVCLLKPITSRPANSERYLIGKWRKLNITPVLEYLTDCHKQMWDWSQMMENKEIMEIIPLQRLKVDKPFFDYIKRHNDENGVKQIQNLRKIVEFHFKPSLSEDRQWEIKNKCLDRWGFYSGEVRKAKEYTTPEEKFRLILNKAYCQSVGFEKTLDKDFLQGSMEREGECRSPYNWKICIVENSVFKKCRGFFLSAGRGRIYKYDGNGKWELLNHFHFQRFEMADNSLLYGEIVTEYFGDVPNQRSSITFHIIDAMLLGGKDIRGLPLYERNRWCQAFAKSMNKTHTVSGCGAFRAKELIPLERAKSLLQSLRLKLIKGRGKKMNHLLSPVYLLGDQQEMPYIEASGLLFVQEIRDPWLKVFSRSQGKMYYFNAKTNYKDFVMPPDACADFVLSMSNRLFWKWDKDVDLSTQPQGESGESDSSKASNKVHAETILKWLEDTAINGVK